MIRFIYLGAQIAEGHRDFAFYDTAREEFRTFVGLMIFASVEEFEDCAAFKAVPGINMRPGDGDVDACRAAIPDWYMLDLAPPEAAVHAAYHAVGEANARTIVQAVKAYLGYQSTDVVSQEEILRQVRALGARPTGFGTHDTVACPFCGVVNRVGLAAIHAEDCLLRRAVVALESCVPTRNGRRR